MVSMIVLVVLDFISFDRLLTASIFPDKGHRAGPERNWASNNPGFHSVSPEPALANNICSDLYYRMAKMKRILSTFTLLSLHLTRLLRIPIKTFSI